ncbi:unnamed protein product [Prorocentrum cordatum]|uniref:Uncharacterized protein n=1 Tax=Prorocentrum cordatum TaxID=2364126 RepID=A0ABN9TTZ9_9DINO|nr:unnamed protein product [Polarella glacialis]
MDLVQAQLSAQILASWASHLLLSKMVRAISRPAGGKGVPLSQATCVAAAVPSPLGGDFLQAGSSSCAQVTDHSAQLGGIYVARSLVEMGFPQYHVACAQVTDYSAQLGGNCLARSVIQTGFPQCILRTLRVPHPVTMTWPGAPTSAADGHRTGVKPPIWALAQDMTGDIDNVESKKEYVRIVTELDKELLNSILQQ